MFKQSGGHFWNFLVPILIFFCRIFIYSPSCGNKVVFVFFIQAFFPSKKLLLNNLAAILNFFCGILIYSQSCWNKVVWCITPIILKTLLWFELSCIELQVDQFPIFKNHIPIFYHETSKVRFLLSQKHLIDLTGTLQLTQLLDLQHGRLREVELTKFVEAFYNENLFEKHYMCKGTEKSFMFVLSMPNKMFFMTAL